MVVTPRASLQVWWSPFPQPHPLQEGSFEGERGVVGCHYLPTPSPGCQDLRGEVGAGGRSGGGLRGWKAILDQSCHELALEFFLRADRSPSSFPVWAPPSHPRSRVQQVQGLLPTPRCQSPRQLGRAGSPQCCSSEPSLQSGCPSHCGLGFFTQLRSSHWKVNVPQGTPGIGQGTEGGSLSLREPPKQASGKMDQGRGQEVGGEGSLDHTEGAPGAPLGSPKVRPCLSPPPAPSDWSVEMRLSPLSDWVS